MAALERAELDEASAASRAISAVRRRARTSPAVPLS
jgi:hypothetical protein